MYVVNFNIPFTRLFAGAISGLRISPELKKMLAEEHYRTWHAHGSAGVSGSARANGRKNHGTIVPTLVDLGGLQHQHHSVENPGMDVVVVYC